MPTYLGTPVLNLDFLLEEVIQLHPIADCYVNQQEIEDTTLRLLKEAKGNILDDEILINTLAESRVTSAIIDEKAEEAAVTMAKIQSSLGSASSF